MTDLTPTEQHTRRPFLGLSRVAGAGALALMGLFAPSMAGASPAQPVGGGDGLEGQPQPCWQTDTCPPPVPCEDDPEKECPPPPDPCDEDPEAEGCLPPPPPPPPPGVDEPPVVVVEVDAPVRATPTFTG